MVLTQLPLDRSASGEPETGNSGEVIQRITRLIAVKIVDVKLKPGHGTALDLAAK
jgi:hypothetical protein